MAGLLDPLGRYVVSPLASKSALRPPPPGSPIKPGKPKPKGPKGPGGTDPQNQVIPKPKGPGYGGPQNQVPKGSPKGIGNAGAWQDATYLDQMRLMNKALNDYKAAIGLKKTRLGTENAASENELNQQKTTDLVDIENDFASRGVLKSGVYGQRLGQYDADFNTALAELARRYKDSLTDLDLGAVEYQNEMDLQLEQAKLDAILRRAAMIEAGDVDLPYKAPKPKAPAKPAPKPKPKPRPTPKAPIYEKIVPTKPKPKPKKKFGGG